LAPKAVASAPTLAGVSTTTSGSPASISGLGNSGRAFDRKGRALEADLRHEGVDLAALRRLERAVRDGHDHKGLGQHDDIGVAGGGTAA